MKQKPKILVLVGPTASGKSDLAVKLAKKFNGEVISADSRQVYRGMDIGTGKITPSEMHGVPHHLLDVVSPQKTFTVADYVRKGERALVGILGRGKLPIVCGGAGFYISALVDGVVLPDVPPDPNLRRHLNKKTVQELFILLKTLDPRRAKTIDAKNPRRLIRAIEIARTLGKVPIAKQRPPTYDILWLGLRPPNEILRQKIHSRLFARLRLTSGGQARIKEGMVAEAKHLHRQGVSWKRMEEFGLEYRYLARYLQKKVTKQEMLAELEKGIWRYAKRQMTWFKKNKLIQWISGDPKEAERLVKKFL